VVAKDAPVFTDDTSICTFVVTPDDTITVSDENTMRRLGAAE
jgi:hypothetical protein